MKRVVYHGTHRSFVEHVRENGLSPPKGSPGVRVRLNDAMARKDARAWSAAMMVEQQLPPVGMIVVATLDQSRLRLDRHGMIRVRYLAPEEVELRGPIEFPEFGYAAFQAGKIPPDLSAVRAAVTDALDHYDALTDSTVTRPFPRQRVRRG